MSHEQSMMGLCREQELDKRRPIEQPELSRRETCGKNKVKLFTGRAVKILRNSLVNLSNLKQKNKETLGPVTSSSF